MSDYKAAKSQLIQQYLCVDLGTNKLELKRFLAFAAATLMIKPKQQLLDFSSGQLLLC